MRIPAVQSEFFALGGGLDLLTPAIAMQPGKVITSQNYEPEIGGGYRRIDGFECYDGKALPSSKGYWIAPVTLSSAVAVGDTITGVSSGATSKVLFQYTGILVLGNVSGTYTPGESITVGTIGAVTANSAVLPSDHADYMSLAADLWRLSIGVVPGSGIIRGIWSYNDVQYAFRDNAGGTAGDMYKSTSGGWVKVVFGSEIQFTGAVDEFFAGNVVYGNTSGATATIVKPMLRTGSWTSAGAGTLILSGISGTFQNGEALKLTNGAGATKVTSASLATAITRLPGGVVTCVNDNFTGSTSTKKMYGADGVNLAFEFDGTNYIPIRTGMVVDTPKHIAVHKFYLVLSFLGSVQFSGIGNPYTWSVVLGAAEIGTGKVVTGLQIQTGGGANGASLAIFTEGKTFILYGDTTGTFRMVPSTFDIGAMAYTVQPIGNDNLMLTNRGIQRLVTTLNYGDFEFASVSHLIQPLITAKRGLQICSVTLKTKNQYRVYFSDGTGLAVGLTGDKITAIMVLNYGIPVRCICSSEDATGAEVTYFGSDDGYIYKDNSGTSFNGLEITAVIRLPFNNLKSPRIRKHFRSAIVELSVVEFSQVDVTYLLGYGTPDVEEGIALAATQMVASGSFWDSFAWDSFTWDAQMVNNPRLSLNGIEKNISLLFYSSRKQDRSHTLQGVTINSTPTRQER